MYKFLLIFGFVFLNSQTEDSNSCNVEFAEKIEEEKSIRKLKMFALCDFSQEKINYSEMTVRFFAGVFGVLTARVILTNFFHFRHPTQYELIRSLIIHISLTIILNTYYYFTAKPAYIEEEI